MKYKYPDKIVEIATNNKISPRELVSMVWNNISTVKTCYRNCTPDKLTHLECLSIIEFLKEKDLVEFNGRDVYRYN